MASSSDDRLCMRDTQQEATRESIAEEQWGRGSLSKPGRVGDALPIPSSRCALLRWCHAGLSFCAFLPPVNRARKTN